jgi:hypothetical protein
MALDRRFHLHDGQMGAAITVRVTPRSSKNEIQEILKDGTIKIRITSAPVEGHANETLIRFLAEVLNISMNQVEIIAGKTGRDKLISIIGLDANIVQQRIMEKIK